MASAGISSSAARSASSWGCEAPSRKEKLEWQWSSTNGLVIEPLQVPAVGGQVLVDLGQQRLADQDLPVLASDGLVPPVLLNQPTVDRRGIAAQGLASDAAGRARRRRLDEAPGGRCARAG